MATAATESTKTPVTMTDGRVVEFTTKQKLVKEATIDNGVVTGRFDFRNGETRTFTIPESLILRFAAHGMEQKIGDAIAGESDLDDAVLSVDDLIKRLSAGEWTATRASGGFSGSSILLRALWEFKGSTTDEDKAKVKAFLDSKTQAEKIAMRRIDALVPIITRLEAEKAKSSKSTVDTSSLMGELDALGSDAAAPVAEPAETVKSRKAASE